MHVQASRLPTRRRAKDANDRHARQLLASEGAVSVVEALLRFLQNHVDLHEPEGKQALGLIVVQLVCVAAAGHGCLATKTYTYRTLDFAQERGRRREEQ